jgi:hypothetical protein
MAKNKITLDRRDEDNLVIKLNGKEIASFNHDEDGWAGMESAENLVVTLAERLNIPVERK